MTAAQLDAVFAIFFNYPTIMGEGDRKLIKMTGAVWDSELRQQEPEVGLIL
jgi:hypothetical protein